MRRSSIAPIADCLPRLMVCKLEAGACYPDFVGIGPLDCFLEGAHVGEGACDGGACGRWERARSVLGPRGGEQDEREEAGRDESAELAEDADCPAWQRASRALEQALAARFDAQLQ